MAVILEVKAGPFTGRKISLSVGQVFLVGRTAERAQFAVPHDNLMSGVHFAIECGPSGSSVIDKGSTNGTYLNGAKIQKAMFLSNGDEIKSGQTIFVVRIVSGDAFSALPFSPVSASQPPAPSSSQHPGQAPALTIGSWAFHKIPNGWQIQERLGIQQVVKDAFPSSIGAIEEPLGPGLTLQHYVDAHTKMFREHLRDPKISVAVPPVIHGSVETAAHKSGGTRVPCCLWSSGERP